MTGSGIAWRGAGRGAWLAALAILAAAAVAILAGLALATPARAAGAPRSPFAWRGIVEGSYGAPWNHGQRLRMLAWMSAHGLNAYVHAPKQDPYQRGSWRRPYPPALQRQFDQEIAFARSRGIQWIPSLSPAIPAARPATAGGRSRELCFSCRSDLDAVLAKLAPFARAGARTFMISFDDVRLTLADPHDRAVYGGRGANAFGRANADFLNRLYGALSARLGYGVRLLTIGADYYGTTDSAYLRGLRAPPTALRPQISVMWTGDASPSNDFTPRDARAYGALIGRQPIVWDNWSNDDGTTTGRYGTGHPYRLFLGPYRRRPDVVGAVGGFFLNPMNEADVNMLPLATAADWLRDPYRYRASSSWSAAVHALTAGTRLGTRLTEELRAWAQTSYLTKFGGRRAPTFNRLRESFLRAYAHGARWQGRLVALRHELALTRRAGADLGWMPDHHFGRDLGPFLASAARAASAGDLGARLLAAERPRVGARRVGDGFRVRARPPSAGVAAGLRRRLRRVEPAVRSSTFFVYGYRRVRSIRLPFYAAPRTNLMDRFLTQVHGFDGAWRRRARRATTSVQVFVARPGRAARHVHHDRTGRLGLSPADCGALVLARDGAGGRDSLRLPACPRR